VFKTLIDADELMKSNPNITNINHSISRLCREMYDKIVFKMNDHNLTKQGKVIETFAKVDEMLNCTFKPKRSHNCIEQSNKVHREDSVDLFKIYIWHNCVRDAFGISSFVTTCKRTLALQIDIHTNHVNG